MITRRLFPALVFTVLILLVSACGSRKKVTRDTTEYTGDLAPLATMVEKVNVNRQTEEFVTSRMQLNLYSGKRKISVGGHLRMRRDDVIQMSLIAFGVVEVARVEITKDYFMIVDRTGRQYLKEAYKDIPFFRNAGINFYTFQSLFWDELFVLGMNGEAPTDEYFTKTMDNNVAYLVNNDSKAVKLSFVANMLNGLITQTRIQDKENEEGPAMQWDYLTYTKLGVHEFPSKMEIRLDALAQKPISATLILANVKSDEDWEYRTELSKKRYKQVPLQQVFSRIMSLTH